MMTSTDIPKPIPEGDRDPERVSPDALEAIETFAEPALEKITASKQSDDLDLLVPIAEMIHSLTDYEKQRFDPETGQLLTVDKITVEIPIELRVSEGETGRVTIEGSAPSQRTETTVLPIFHHLQLRIVKDPHGR